MSLTNDQIATVRQLCREEGGKWTIDTTVDPALLPDGMIRRRLPAVDREYADILSQYLRDYTSEVNNTTRQPYATGLYVNTKAMAGTWRGGLVTLEPSQQNEGSYDIVQELREGLLTSLDYTEARFLQSRRYTGDGASNPTEEYVILQWKAVNPDTLSSLASAKVDTAALASVGHRNWDNPAAAVSIGSDWHHIGTITRLEDPPDGSGTVEMLIGKPEVVYTGHQDWGGWGRFDVTTYWNVPKQLAQALVDTFQAAGKSAYVTGVSDGLCGIQVRSKNFTAVTVSSEVTAEDCNSQTTSDFSFGGSNAAALPITFTSGHALIRKLFLNPDGSVNIIRSDETPKKQDTGWISYNDGDGTSYVRIFLNAESTDLTSITGGFTSATVNSISVRPNRYCRLDITAHRKYNERQASVGSSSDWDNFEVTKTVYKIHRSSDPNTGLPVSRRVPYTYGVKQTTSNTAAYNFIASQDDGRVEIIGGNRYRAVYLTQGTAPSWSADSTGLPI